MRVLIACEFSGIVREAFAKRGHDAWSIDLEPSEKKGNHIQGDVLNYLDGGWDLMIAHPPCQHLSISCSRLWAAKQADGRQPAAMEFFMRLIDAPVPLICVESATGIMSTAYRKPDQIIQPYWFGHLDAKRTCLWLKGLPLLVPTSRMPKPATGWKNLTPSGNNKVGEQKDRAKIRSRTYKGIATAMAMQWGVIAAR